MRENPEGQIIPLDHLGLHSDNCSEHYSWNDVGDHEGGYTGNLEPSKQNPAGYKDPIASRKSSEIK